MNAQTQTGILLSKSFFSDRLFKLATLASALLLSVGWTNLAWSQEREPIEGFWESLCAPVDPSLLGKFSKLVVRIEKALNSNSYDLKVGFFVFAEEDCESAGVVQAFGQFGKFDSLGAFDRYDQAYEINIQENVGQWRPGAFMESVLRTPPEEVPKEGQKIYLIAKKAEAQGVSWAKEIQKSSAVQFTMKKSWNPVNLSEAVDELHWKILGKNPSESLLYRSYSLDLSSTGEGRMRKPPKYLRKPKNPQET